MAKEADAKALQAKLDAWEQEKKDREEEAQVWRKQLADSKFEQVRELVEQYGQFFDSGHKKQLADLLGMKTRGPSIKRPASNKPKKYRLPTGEEWGGQGGDKMAPQAFKEWRKNNPKAEWPKNPDYPG